MNILIDDEYYDICITRKNNKNLYIRVDDDLNINVSCPYIYTNKMVEKFTGNYQCNLPVRLDKIYRVTAD